MADIFISYARDVRSKAHLLAETFKRRNWSVWWDTRLQAGEVWDEVIEHELNNAHCLVVLWSKTSVARRWVRAEANEGLQRGILVPVLLEHVRPPLAFRLVQAESLLGWSGEPSHSGLDRLLAAIEHVLGQEEQRRVGFERMDQALKKNHDCKNGAFQYVSVGSKADARDRITRGAAPETKGARNLEPAALGEGFKPLGVLGWLSLASGLLCSLSISLAYFLGQRYDTNAVNILFRAALVLSLCSIILFLAYGSTRGMVLKSSNLMALLLTAGGLHILGTLFLSVTAWALGGSFTGLWCYYSNVFKYAVLAFSSGA